MQPVLERLSRAWRSCRFAAHAHAAKDAEKDLLKLSIAVARRVLHRELTLDPMSIEGLIKVALDKLESRELSRVRVHPDQEARGARVDRALLHRATSSNVVADTSLHQGDVLLETTHGTVDASVDTQLREIERGFADRLQR